MAGGMRLIVSCISSFLILSLLLFMVHRLRQRRRERIESLIGANCEYQLYPVLIIDTLVCVKGRDVILLLDCACVLVGSSNFCSEYRKNIFVCMWSEISSV